MLRISAFAIVCVGLVSCATSDELNFERMTDIELARYNAAQEPQNRVMCRESEVRTGSHIASRNCYRISEDGNVIPVHRERAFTYNGLEGGAKAVTPPKKVRLL